MPHARRDPRAEALLGQDELQAGVVGHELDALGGVGGIEGHVGTPGLEGAEDGLHHRRRAVEEDANEGPGRDPEAAQVACETIRPVVELAVAQPAAAEDEGCGIRSALRLPGEEIVDAGLGDGAGRVVPGPEEPIPFLRGDKIDLGERALRPVADAGDDRAELGGQGLYPAVAEQPAVRAVEGQRDADPPRRRLHADADRHRRGQEATTLRGLVERGIPGPEISGMGATPMELLARRLYGRHRGLERRAAIELHAERQAGRKGPVRALDARGQPVVTEGDVERRGSRPARGEDGDRRQERVDPTGLREALEETGLEGAPTE